ncbi:MAG: hypothetical protein AAF725_12905 [Acidobacteriota bacterium]
MPTTLPPRASPPEAQSEPEDPRLKRLQLSFLWISVLALLGLSALVFVAPPGGRPKPLLVVAPTPQISFDGAKPGSGPGPGPEAEALLREAILDSAERHLAARVGLQLEVVDAADEPSRGEMARMANARGADEVLLLGVRCANRGPSGSRCYGSIRRLRAVDGSLQWRRDFRMPLDPLKEVDQALGDQLNVAFRKFRRLSGGARLYCSPAEMDDYLDTLVLLRAGGLSPREAALRLRSIRETARRFYGVYLREAEQRLATGDAVERRLAVELLEEARRIAPDDWRAPRMLTPVLLEQSGSGRALDSVLAQLRRLLPGDPQVEAWQGQLGAAAAQGGSTEAAGKTKSGSGAGPKEREGEPLRLMRFL